MSLTWLDDGMDWTNPKMWEKRYLLALSTALKHKLEVCSASGGTSPLFMYCNRIIKDKGSLSFTELSDIDGLLKSIVDLFVDHRLGGGDFSGLILPTQVRGMGMGNLYNSFSTDYYVTTGSYDGRTYYYRKQIFNYWTWDTIINAIGLNRTYILRNNCSAKSENVKMWAIQCYKILNLLRWYCPRYQGRIITFCDGRYKSGSTRFGEWDSYGGYGSAQTSVAEAISAFNNTIPQEYDAYWTLPYISLGVYTSSGLPNRYMMTGWSSKVKFTMPDFREFVPNGIDVYIPMVCSPSSDLPPITVGRFQPLASNQWWQSYWDASHKNPIMWVKYPSSIVEAGAESKTFDRILGEESSNINFNGRDFESGVSFLFEYGQDSYSPHNYSARIVYKFDGDGGFPYRDW